MGNVSWIENENEIIKSIIKNNPDVLFRSLGNITNEIFESINTVAPVPRSRRAILKKLDNTLQDIIGIRKDEEPTKEEYAEAISIPKKQIAVNHFSIFIKGLLFLM